MGSIKSISDLLITKNILINENNQNNSDIEDLNKKLISKKINLSMSVEKFMNEIDKKIIKKTNFIKLFFCIPFAQNKIV